MSLAFAKEFYTQLISGKSVGESLRLSRLKLINAFGIQSFAWTSYLLYGDPNFILFKKSAKHPKQSIKKYILSNKKLILRLSIALAVSSLIVYLCTWLPTLHPNTYLLFLKSKKMYLAGRNQEVILLCNRIKDKDASFLATYSLLADTYKRLGERESALKCYFDYALYSEKRQDKRNLASAYTKIGELYQDEGNYPKAFDFLNKAVSLSRQNFDKLNEAVALRRLAVWFIDKEDYDKALELLLRSSEINRERQYLYEHRYNLACDYFDIGLVFTDKNDFNAAKDFYNKSLKLFQNLKLKNELSDYYFNLGEIHLFEKQYQKALDYYLKGLAIDRQQNNRPNIASDLNMIGELYLEMDNLDEAEGYFNQAAELSKQIKAQPELACIYDNLAGVYKKRGRINQAREYFRQAQEIYVNTDTGSYERIKKELLNLDNPE
jgi:tetratricopeptide (TPR) repeat protein